MKMKGKMKAVAVSVVALVLALNAWLPAIAGGHTQAAEPGEGGNPAGSGTKTQTVEKTLTTAVELKGEANVEGGTNFKNAGWAGMKLTVGDKDIVVTEVGRYCTSRSNATHNLMILNADYSVLRNGMTITRQEETEDGFVYAKLEGEQRVTLQKNSIYYIVADFWGDRDMFYDASVQTTTDDAAIDGIVILEYRSATNNWEWCDYAARNISWGPMDIKYEVEETIKEPVDPVEPVNPNNPTNPGDTPKSLKVLFIGNSVSGTASEYLFQIMKEAGVEDAVVAYLMIGGCPIERHWTNASQNAKAYEYFKNNANRWVKDSSLWTMEAGLKDEDWDIVIFQPTGQGEWGNISVYNEKLDGLTNYVLDKKPDKAKLWWLMPYDYTEAHMANTIKLFPSVALYKGSSRTMHDLTVKATQEKIVPDKRFDGIIPIGTAVWNYIDTMGMSYSDIMSSDGQHLSSAGRYLMGLTIAASFGLPLDPITYHVNGVSSSEVPVYKAAAMAAVEKPFAYTLVAQNPGGVTKPDDSAKPDKENQVKKHEVAFTTDITIAEEGNVPGAKVSFPMGFAGMRITVGGKDIVLTSIGRWYTKGSGLTHNYMIHDTNGNVVLDYGKAVSNAAEGQKDGFVYAKIDGGVTLKANTTYYLLSDYWGENDKFYTASVSKHTTAATLDGIAILNPQTNEFEFYPAEDIGWGPMDFKYLSDSPKTGDIMGWQIPLCICGLLFSVCVFAVAYYFKKRQSA